MTFGRLEYLVREARSRPGAPEILLVEQDVSLKDRGGVYTGTSCYVFPLRAEGFAMTILEAMACGLPVIATAWSGPTDYLSPRYSYALRHSYPIAERGKQGSVLRYHVEPDLEHLIYLMRYVYEHQEEARSLGARASQVVRRDWTWREAAIKIASFFSLQPVAGVGSIKITWGGQAGKDSAT
jgi:glycosyltransferase involved in cell wall biosynthesis